MLDERIITAFPFDLDREADLIVAAYVGSISHNTYISKDDPEAIDDIDILGAALPPASHLIGFGRWRHFTLQQDELDVTIYSLHRLVELWLKSNPNVLGLLWLRPEHYLYRSEAFEAFVAIRDAFAGKQVHKAFGGYALAQLRDIHKNRYEGYMGQKRRALVEQFGYDCKNAAHLIRLLRMDVEFLQTGALNVYRTTDADEIRAIKRGEWSLDQVQAHAGDLFARADELAERSALPARPDHARAESVLIEITRSWLCRQ